VCFFAICVVIASTGNTARYIARDSRRQNQQRTVSQRTRHCDVVSSCAQSQHVMRVLRHHGMYNSTLQTIYQTDVIMGVDHRVDRGTSPPTF